MPHIDRLDEFGDGSKPRAYKDDIDSFMAMRFQPENFATMQNWLSTSGRTSAVNEHRILVIRSGDGMPLPVDPGMWIVHVEKADTLIVFSDRDFREMARPALMCGYPSK